mgnify:FL=1
MAVRKPKSVAAAKDRILSAAIDEFVENGYYGARMQKIADRAKVNKALLHYYYSSKEKIYETVLKKVFELIIEKLSLIEEGKETVERTIEEIIDAYISVFAENTRNFKLMLYEIIRGGGKLLPIAAENIRKIPLNPFTGKLYAYFKRAAKKGEIKDISPLHVFISAIAQVMPVYFAKEMFDKHGSFLGLNKLKVEKFVKERKKVVVEIMMDGIRKNKPKVRGQDPKIKKLEDLWISRR